MAVDSSEIIERYLAKHRLSRAQFADLTGISESNLNKILARQVKASPRALLKISEKTGLVFTAPKVAFDFDLHNYQRADVSHLEGSYQTLRPSFRQKTGIQCFETVISWNNDSACLCFKEIDNDLSPGNAGYVSIPLYQRIIYLLSVKAGNFRLAALSDAYEPGIYYGGLLTVASKTLAAKAPAAAFFILKKTISPDAIVRGMITKEHDRYLEFDKLLSFAKEEGFFDFFD
jgi:transcriptional regulator with XRE-family HTH domain